MTPNQLILKRYAAIPIGEKSRLTAGAWIYQVELDTQTLWILRIRMKTGPETYEGLDALM
ncbi:hypothetical protein [Candidatus Amarolinea aalborgensis]|jgi:hypothetical protein|uniref:hypothetical protein n=1 Tax=Candidatus Amarolinea aalborgensis TaxID=2249329 RepID=UPI003BF954AF